MPAPKYAKKRDISEQDIVKYLRANGVSVYLTHEPFDAILGYGGVNYFAEFKTGKKGLKASQSYFNDHWNGSKVIVLHTVDEARAWLGI